MAPNYHKGSSTTSKDSKGGGGGKKGGGGGKKGAHLVFDEFRGIYVRAEQHTTMGGAHTTTEPGVLGKKVVEHHTGKGVVVEREVRGKGDLVQNARIEAAERMIRETVEVMPRLRDVGLVGSRTRRGGFVLRGGVEGEKLAVWSLIVVFFVAVWSRQGFAGS